MSSQADWGQASTAFDRLHGTAVSVDLQEASEAQTRYTIIDGMIRNVLGWEDQQVTVEERTCEASLCWVDYILRTGDRVVLVEAKRYGAAFPTPTSRRRLKLSGSVLGVGDVARAITQAHDYARQVDVDLVVVTNGDAWCLFHPNARDGNADAHLFTPFAARDQAQPLYEILAEPNVREGSLSLLADELPPVENRLIQELDQVDGRVDRNNIADFIAPALNKALYSDSLLQDTEDLRRCFIPTDARSKFDNLLQMHLSDPKPDAVKPARRIRTGKAAGQLEQLVQTGEPSHAPPVTLIIGPVGAGKSTYLAHFQRVVAADLLVRRAAHWICVDFEKMGPSASPRKFLYAELLEYLGEQKQGNPADFEHAVQPAYEGELAALIRGPLAPIRNNAEKLDEAIANHIHHDYQRIEPYVDKVYTYLSAHHLTVVVLDNVDLLEDDGLESAVFAEGLAFSKRVHCHVIVSIRDSTFVRHRTDSVFDAYELRKLWLDPPPFRQVLSTRLDYSRRHLSGRVAKIPTSGGAQLDVPDLGEFFDIVKDSILSGETGSFVDAMADVNIRRGLSIVTNFLTSGHIQADRAIGTYITRGDRRFRFPFHEVFKGGMLAQWRHFREDRTDCVNLFDARLGARRLRLLRLHLLRYLMLHARHRDSLEVPVS